MYNNLLDALNQIKNDARTKFDSTVELHINLNLDVKKADQMIRFSIVLPKGTGRSVKVATFSSTEFKEADLNLKEEDLDLIVSGKLRVGNDFDVLVTEPSMMPKVSKVARVLGPAGVMPNPKNGTVTTDIKKAIEQLKKGKIEVRTEQNHPIIHTIIGKCSFDSKDLEENLNEIMNNLRSNKPSKAKPDWIKSIFVTSTMGSSYQLDPKTFNL
jgi:large subunit ribosomal protein L1